MSSRPPSPNEGCEVESPPGTCDRTEVLCAVTTGGNPAPTIRQRTCSATGRAGDRHAQKSPAASDRPRAGGWKRSQQPPPVPARCPGNDDSPRSGPQSKITESFVSRRP